MKKCIVIIPALNEEISIGRVIDRVPKLILDQAISVEVVVIDDGSTDSTVKVAKEHGAIVYSNGVNRGVGYSFNKGVQKALELKADYMVNIDADGQMDPQDIEKLILPIYNNIADMVTASRFSLAEYEPNMPKVKRWGNKQVANIVSYICGKKYYDVACGFRAYNKDVLLKLNLKGNYTYTQESFINLAMKDVRIIEVPVRIRGVREYGKSRVASNIFKYAIKSGSIILGAMKSYRPKLLFGSISAMTFICGFIFEVAFLIHFLRTGFFMGYLAFGITGGFLFLVSLFALMFMLLLDSQTQIILNQETLLYYEKQRYYYPDQENNKR